MKPLALTLGALLLCAARLRAGDLASHPTGVPAAPTNARAARNPYDSDSDAVRAGRKLFLRHCADCHGADARGRASAPGLLRAVEGSSPGAVFWFLTNGDRRSGMPSWSRLPEPRRWQIVAFLSALDATPTPTAQK